MMAVRHIGGSAPSKSDKVLIDRVFCKVPLLDGCLIAAGPNPGSPT